MSGPSLVETLLTREVGLLPRPSTKLPISQSFDVSITKAMITSLAYLFITLAAHPRQPPSALTITQQRYILGPHIPSASSTVHNQHEVILTHDRKTIHHHVCPCVRHSTIQFQHLIEALKPVVALFFGDIGRARIRRRLSAMAMELFMYLICLAYMKNSITHTYLCPCL